jgi:hypothetical protein
MLCLECGAEMRLVQVTRDTTMPVSGYEHHTWQCLGCLTLEQRMKFTAVSGEPAKIMMAELTETAPAQPTQTVPIEPTVSMEAIQTVVVKSIEAAPVEPTQINPSEPTHPEPSAAMPKMSARAKALDEKLRNLKERAKAAREAAGETVTRFNRDWNNKSRSVSPPSAPSDASSQVNPDEPSRSPTEPIASPAPISHDAPIAPQSNAPAVTNLRERLGELVRAMRQLSKAR